MEDETKRLLKFDGFTHGEQYSRRLVTLGSSSFIDTSHRVPKELISRFVKICPTCQVRRGGSRLTPPNSRRSSPHLELMPRSPRYLSPPLFRRESVLSGQGSMEKPPTDFLGPLDGQDGWVESQPNMHGRPSMNAGPVRSLGGGPNNLPGSISATLETLTGDFLIAPSHAAYNSSFAATHENSARNF